jgi:hypothetical protein
MSPEKRRIAAWKKHRPAPEWYSFSETQPHQTGRSNPQKPTTQPNQNKSNQNKPNK